MGATQTTNKPSKRYRLISSRKSTSEPLTPKRTDRFRTTMRSITLRALASRSQNNSVSSSNGSTMNQSSSINSPHSFTTMTSQTESDSYLSDFDYRKLSTLTGLAETKINELHREFLILSDNGRLTFERFRSMLDSNPTEQTDLLVRQTFALFDRDGNNYLDFAEFIAAYIQMEKNDFQANERLTSPYSPRISRLNTSSIVPTPRISSRLTTQNPSGFYSPKLPERYVVLSPPLKYR